MTDERQHVRLHRGLYAASAIDDAVALYAPHAAIERADEGEHVVLHITSDREGRAERVARELANYALGLTIQGREAFPMAPSPDGAVAGPRAPSAQKAPSMAPSPDGAVAGPRAPSAQKALAGVDAQDDLSEGDAK